MALRILHILQNKKHAAAISHEAHFTKNLDTSRFGTLATNGYKHAAQAIMSNFRMPNPPHANLTQR